MSAPVIIEQGLLQLFKSFTDVVAMTTLCGIYLNVVPEGAHDPCLLIAKVSATPDATMDGPSGYNIRRYQFTFFSKDFPTALKLQEIVRALFDGYVGVLPNGTRVYNVIRDNEIDGYDDQTAWHHTITDYFIHFAE